MNLCQRLTYIATKGMGAQLLRVGSAGYCIDLLHMSRYKVRHNLCPYGAKLILNQDFEVIGIRLGYTPVIDSHGTMLTFTNQNRTYHPNDNHWLFAYHIFMSSLITHVTLIQHALFCHFKEAGQILYLVSKYENTLSPSLRSFVRLFLYDTASVNNNALRLLVSDGGIIYRIFGFTRSETKRYLYNHFASEDIVSSDINTPFWRDYTKYYYIIKRFVGGILSKITDNLPEHATELVYEYQTIMNNSTIDLESILIKHIITVSFWHEHVGNMSWYLFNPSVARSKVFKEFALEPFDARQNSLQSIHLALYTSINKMPGIMSQLETKMDTEFFDHFIDLQKDLEKWKFECNHLDPRNFECSVSL